VVAIDDAGSDPGRLQKLRSDAEMMPLADAARCRSESDWLIGINGTRAMTAFNSKEGGFYLTTVGGCRRQPYRSWLSVKKK
jgi:DNA topoisomerase IA